MTPMNLITNKMIKLTKTLKDELWWLIISVDYDYSRIAIADYELNDQHLILWLEDKHDFKNTLDECLQLNIPAKQFAKLIKDEGFNSYDGSKMHPDKSYLYKDRIEINKPLAWYQDDASLTEQTWAREAVVKKLLTYLVENEARGLDEANFS
jgi:hypothetical protein